MESRRWWRPQDRLTDRLDPDADARVAVEAADPKELQPTLPDLRGDRDETAYLIAVGKGGGRGGRRRAGAGR
jgi:hypothetical protein